MAKRVLVKGDTTFSVSATKEAFGTKLIVNGTDLAPNVVGATIYVRVGEPTRVILDVLGTEAEIEAMAAEVELRPTA